MTSWTDREIVDELCEIDAGLNDWELDFVQDIARRVMTNVYTLSDAQRHKAEEILRKNEEA